MKKVLFVCTGNICRSPTAEGIFLHLVKERNIQNMHADSAAIESYHIGDGPDSRTIKAGKTRGYDLSALRARQIDLDDFHDFNLILAMDKGHYKALDRMRPKDAKATVRMFADEDVPDPYYGQWDGFIDVLDRIEQRVITLLDELK